MSGHNAEPEFWEEFALGPAPVREEMLISAIANSFIAIEHLLLMAAALQLGTCWLGATNDARLNKLFGLSDNLVSVAVITVGYPALPIPRQRPRISMGEMLLKPLP